MAQEFASRWRVWEFEKLVVTKFSLRRPSSVRGARRRLEAPAGDASSFGEVGGWNRGDNRGSETRIPPNLPTYARGWMVDGLSLR